MNNWMIWWVFPAIVTLIAVCIYCFRHNVTLINEDTFMLDILILVGCVILYPLGMFVLIYRWYDDNGRYILSDKKLKRKTGYSWKQYQQLHEDYHWLKGKLDDHELVRFDDVVKWIRDRENIGKRGMSEPMLWQQIQNPEHGLKADLEKLKKSE